MKGKRCQKRAYTRPTNSDQYGQVFTVTQKDVQAAYIEAQSMFEEALSSGRGKEDPLYAQIQAIVESSITID